MKINNKRFAAFNLFYSHYGCQDFTIQCSITSFWHYIQDHRETWTPTAQQIFSRLTSTTQPKF